MLKPDHVVVHLRPWRIDEAFAPDLRRRRAVQRSRRLHDSRSAGSVAMAVTCL